MTAQGDPIAWPGVLAFGAMGPPGARTWGPDALSEMAVFSPSLEIKLAIEI